jgi:SAM-dependent methyltransferase
LPGFESRLLLRRIINLPRDSFETLTGRRNPLIPPHGLWFVGGEQNYQQVNDEYLGYFTSLGHLQPHHDVLDVGCGIGIMASRLSSYLSPAGSYCGFDIVRIGIEWAQKRISSRFPNFSFVHADLFNKHYNPRGVLSPNSFRFPYPDAAFDFVFVKSVFTHLLPDSIQHYLSEIHRVLRPTGCCLASIFLMNAESLESIGRGESSLALTHYSQDCYVLDPDFPETAVGISESSFLKWCAATKFVPTVPIFYGSWCGRESFMSYQDVALLHPS